MIRKLPQYALIAGIVLIVVSVVWWQQTFGINFDYIKCIAFSDGVCRLSRISKLFGGTSYNPMIFWIGVICLVAGWILKKLRIF